MAEDVRERIGDTQEKASVGDAAGALAGDVANVVRAEFDRALEQLRAGARESGLALGMLGGAAMCGTLAVGGASLLVLRLLETKLPRPLAAAVVTAVYSGGAVGLAATGIRSLRAARESVVSAAAEPRG